MKKSLIALSSLMVVAMLSGCGDMRVTEPMMTSVPYVTANPDDGVVNDRDGIIDDNNDTDYEPSNGSTGRRIGTVDTGRNGDYDR